MRPPTFVAVTAVASALVVGVLTASASAVSSGLARTDRSLLGETSSRPISVMVKLDYDAVAAYAGDIKGLPATSPAVTGRPLNPGSEAVRRYTDFVRESEGEFLDALDAELPAATPGTRLRTAYGGLALTVPADRVERLLELPGVAAVQRDDLERITTDSSPQFIGAPTLYGRLGQTANDAGKGVIVGVLDTGGWPEHPSFADRGNLPPPPPKADGTPRTCNFGDNPLTPQSDVFSCQNKLISGQPFLATYNSVFTGERYPDSARDSHGHGTHTASTAAGGPVADANPLGISRGAIRGIAPGAYVAHYKVCGREGCVDSDAVDAVEQAILDGVDVINFSISGGGEPFEDPVELAFLDAYAAGIVVSTSAGNDGPDAGTVHHRSPWVMSVAASSHQRAFRSTISLDGGALRLSGASLTAGVGSPLPVVSATAAPYLDPGCSRPAPAGLFTGKIVVCRSTGLRVGAGDNVLKGGAAGMILYSPVSREVSPDLHWLPSVHIDPAAGEQLLAYLAAHPAATASFTAGAATSWRADRVAHFSGRGPGGDWIKPDLAAPGIHVLAGMTPTPEDADKGPPGNLFQAVSGTSMAAPHAAGSAALLAALHPTWTPGQIKSALATTARASGITKSDGVAPADVFDAGSGRVELTRAGDPGLTFDETANGYAASAATPGSRLDLNTPSVNAPRMAGVISTTRTARNVTKRTLIYQATTQSAPGTSISVGPALIVVGPGRSVDLRITMSAPAAPSGQYLGRITLNQVGGSSTVGMPVAFLKQPSPLTLEQSCVPTSIRVLRDTSTCTVTVRNPTSSAADVQLESTTSLNLPVTAATGATRVNAYRVTAATTLAGPGGVLTYSFRVRGLVRGTGTVRTDMTTPLVPGATRDVDEITVNR